MDKQENASSRLALVLPGVTVAAMAGAICVAIFANPGSVAGYQHRAPERTLAMARAVARCEAIVAQRASLPVAEDWVMFGRAIRGVGRVPTSRWV